MSFFNSTYRQLTLMFGVLLLINAVVIILVFRHYSILPAGQQMGNFISQQIVLLEPLLSHRSLDQKQKQLSALYPSGQIIVRETKPKNDLPSLKFYSAIRKALNQKKLTHIKYQTKEKQTIIWVKSLNKKSEYWYGFTFESFMSKTRQLMRTIFITLLFISLCAAYGFSRYSLRPLKRLADIARAQSKDPAYLPGVSVEGSKEVREVAKLVQRTILKHQQLADEKQIFLAGVSHDLRTPLTRIRFQLEWLENVEIRNDIVIELDEMNQIIDDFMGFIKDPNTLTPPVGIEINDVIKYIKGRYDVEQFGIQFDIKNPESLLAIHGSHIKRVLMNLIDNSIHHGQPPIIISFNKNKQVGVLTIQDHGSGMTNNQPIATEYQGYGFGLKVVKKLLAMNNAKYIFKSHPKNGLTVHIEIRLV